MGKWCKTPNPLAPFAFLAAHKRVLFELAAARFLIMGRAAVVKPTMAVAFMMRAGSGAQCRLDAVFRNDARTRSKRRRASETALPTPRRRDYR
jgi:hypothetical protein